MNWIFERELLHSRFSSVSRSRQTQSQRWRIPRQIFRNSARSCLSFRNLSRFLSINPVGCSKGNENSFPRTKAKDKLFPVPSSEDSRSLCVHFSVCCVRMSSLLPRSAKVFRQRVNWEIINFMYSSLYRTRVIFTWPGGEGLWN